MADPYSGVSISGYNANPPDDDGSQTENNRITWAKSKDKLGDPLKDAVEGIDANVAAAISKMPGGAGITTTSISYTVVEADQGKLVRATSSGITITTPDATSVGAPFRFEISNDSSGDVTLDGNGSQTVDGDASTVIPAGCGLIVQTDGTNWLTSGQNFPRPVVNPPAGSRAKLAIDVASNTTVTVAADYVTMTDGTTFVTHALSGTINLGSNGAANRLDTGTIAQATWYSIWAIAKADGTTAGLASLSATSPTLPTDYIYKARIGWVRTAAATAQLLGTRQRGNKAQYVVGLAQCAALPNVAPSGTYGSITVPTYAARSVSSAVPSTASRIGLTVHGEASVVSVLVAPNGSYGEFTSTTNPPFYGWSAPSSAAPGPSLEMMLESTNVYFASNTSASLWCNGWEDNL